MKKKNVKEKKLAREAARKKTRRKKIYLTIICTGLAFMLLGLIVNLVSNYI